jgi:hypothetical protein
LYQSKNNDETFTKDEIKFKGFQLYYINEFKSLLNIDNYDHCKITRDNINKCIEFIEVNRNHISKCFEVRDQKKTKNENNFKECLMALNKIFENFNGCKIVGDINDFNKSKKVFNSYKIIKHGLISATEEVLKSKINEIFVYNNYNENYEEDIEDKEEIYKKYLFVDTDE